MISGCYINGIRNLAYYQNIEDAGVRMPHDLYARILRHVLNEMPEVGSRVLGAPLGLPSIITVGNSRFLDNNCGVFTKHNTLRCIKLNCKVAYQCQGMLPLFLQYRTEMEPAEAGGHQL